MFRKHYKRAMDGMNWWMRLEGMTSGICDFPSSKKMFCMLMSRKLVLWWQCGWQTAVLLIAFSFRSKSTCQTNLLPSHSGWWGCLTDVSFRPHGSQQKTHHFGTNGMNWYTFCSLPPPKSKVFFWGRRCKLQFCRLKLTSIKHPPILVNASGAIWVGGFCRKVTFKKDPQAKFGRTQKGGRFCSLEVLDRLITVGWMT